MTDPRVTGQHELEPVQTGAGGPSQRQWSARLVQFLRAMTGLSLIKGLYHWAVVCGFYAPADGAFAAAKTPYQAATVFFAVIDLVAAVGLWLAAPWGAVVWLTSVISMVAVEFMFPQIYGGRIWVVVLECTLLASYLWLAIFAAREQPM